LASPSASSRSSCTAEKIGVANGGQPGAIVEFTIPAASRVAAAEVVTA